MLAFAALLVVVAVAESSLTAEWIQVVYRMVTVSAIVVAVNIWSQAKPSRKLGAFKVFYIVPLVPIFFKTVEILTRPFYTPANDQILIATDRLLCFGANPTYWLASHLPNSPWLTCPLMISYSLFYFIPISLVVEFYLRSRSGDTLAREHVNDFVFIVVYGFLISYASYFILPSIGPRFYLHDFFALSRDLPGGTVTEFLRNLLNRGENIEIGMTLPQIVQKVSCDAFPSGHTDITLLSVLFAFRYRASLRWYLLVIAASLVLSTVYLRYHYVTDLLGGAVLAVVTLYTWEWVRDRMSDHRMSARTTITAQ